MFRILAKEREVRGRALPFEQPVLAPAQAYLSRGGDPADAGSLPLLRIIDPLSHLGMDKML
jgi:hypothetical protein